MQWQPLLALTLLAAPFANALLRFPCSQLVTQRLDPLVTPGVISPHVHQIVGGNAFNISMDPNVELDTLATCTTCRFKEDKSNYWTAVMYFKHSNGSYMRVPQMANQFVGSPNGGMTVYYIQPPNNQKVTAFKKGFRMIVGDPMLRNRNIQSGSPEGNALTFRCFGENFGNNTAAPGGGTDTVTFPPKVCKGGIRSNIYFPSCWDGKTLDPPDHHSHVAYPQGTVQPGGLFFNPGTCPSTHPVRLPLLFTETVWDTRQFVNIWPTDGSQPLVFSMGDPTGYGQHGDYVFGWQGDSLQRAMDTCTDQGGQPESCRALTVVSDADINRCTQKAVVNEVVEGQYLRALPGCNPVQNGPSTATMVDNCSAAGGTQTTATVPSTTSVATTTTTTASTTTTVVVPTPQGPAIPKYGQCGGNGWTGATTCVAGSTCTKLNDWYSQCT
ncbi:hypothetical protein DFP72DRAFT_881756 [Ephemerocybe angulata]|uniref:CBM1 domain-containing protein n=1 Tax=Ephemerocybe angulata TaxID=980116 RepID=A0A8H6MCL0_9AGAR|nr:hypothetical protein DFP72DRAFT_881756 [Tulosesus angulatus]